MRTHIPERTEITCDICNRVMTKETLFRLGTELIIVHNVWDSQGQVRELVDTQRFDLCDDCATDLSNAITAKKTEIESSARAAPKAEEAKAR